MVVFDFTKYKEFVVARIQEMPKRGHGQFRKIAAHLSTNSVTISQIFNGDRHLTAEQAVELAEFFGLSSLESEYFVALVERERAGTQKLKKFIDARLALIKDKAQDLKSRLKHDGVLPEEAKAIFYSDWFYSGIRLLTSIEGFDNPDAIAAYFGLSLAKTNKVLEFLTSRGLCVSENGKLKMGPSSTHLEASSPLISRLHTNWRLKAIEKFPSLTSQELCLSMPCSMSESAFKEIRKDLVDCIERITKVIDSSPSDHLACVNIDFFKF